MNITVLGLTELIAEYLEDDQPAQADSKPGAPA